MSFFSKIGKKLKKIVKKVGKVAGAVNPLIPGGKAQKQLSSIAKKALLPTVGAAIGTGIISGAQGGGSVSDTGGFFGDVSGLFNKAGKFAEGLRNAFGSFSGGGGTTDMGPAPAPAAPGASSGNESGFKRALPWIAGGAAVLLVVYVVSKKK